MNLINTDQYKKNKKNLDDSMIPAINIVFLLLIFFMIAGHIEKRDTQLLIPKSSSETKLSKQEVNIKVMPNGDYYINDSKIQNLLIEEFKLLALSKDSIITCHIHHELPVSKLDPILEALQIFGVKQINIATQRY